MRAEYAVHTHGLPRSNPCLVSQKGLLWRFWAEDILEFNRHFRKRNILIILLNILSLNLFHHPLSLIFFQLSSRKWRYFTDSKINTLGEVPLILWPIYRALCGETRRLIHSCDHQTSKRRKGIKTVSGGTVQGDQPRQHVLDLTPYPLKKKDDMTK